VCVAVQEEVGSIDLCTGESFELSGISNADEFRKTIGIERGKKSDNRVYVRVPVDFTNQIVLM
jgi:phage tail sheath gpL-like